MNTRLFLILGGLATTAGMVMGACTTTSSTTGGGGDGGATVAASVAASTAASTAGSGGGPACVEHCAEIVADNTATACEGSSAATLYKAFADCVCLPANCGSTDCSVSCDDPTMDPTDACISCGLALTQTSCNDEFVACSNDVPQDGAGGAGGSTDAAGTGGGGAGGT